MFDSVLIANRGEIAVRILQTAKELGIETVAVFSDADESAKHVRLADRALPIGPPVARKSYLDQSKIIDAARESGVDAIHPGYGFLAENAEFARRVECSEFTWIGPPAETIRNFGGKMQSRALMDDAGVPVVPGTLDPIEHEDEVRSFAEEHGYPVAIKADGGGGGRGLKIVNEPGEISEQLQNAKREGESFFDNPSVYLEKFLENPRHIEVQVLADTHGNVIHLYERDCSIQRRQQKLIEETPSPSLDESTRTMICEAARRGVEKIGYVSAGTVEFLYQESTDRFYFLEMNTRIQVEHTITEATTGVDLVEQQFRIATGEELQLNQTDIKASGAAIEFRINAEDPIHDFAPSPGRLETYRRPTGIGVRIDDGVDQGDDVVPFYDSLIAKFVISARDRDRAIARSRRALRETEITGISTTIPFHLAVLEDERFQKNQHTTKYVDRESVGLD